MVEVRNAPILRTIPLLVAIWLMVLPAHAQYSGGSGTAVDPYQIATAADLIALGETPADYDKHFILTADIDLDPNLPGRKVFDKAVIAPDTNPNDFLYGFQGTRFTGLFNGNGHTISNLTVTGAYYVGLFGQLSSDARVKDLGLVGVRVTGTGYSIGGLAGYNTGASIIRCYSTGVVNGVMYVGGLVGEQRGGTVTNCYSHCVVNCTAYTAGGLVGNLYSGAVTQCYSTGRVTGSSVGGLFGSGGGFRAPVNDCFWDTQTSGQSKSSGGTGKTTAEMKMAATFSTWDFDGTWMIQEGVDYPRLQWEVYGVPSPTPATVEKISGDNQCGRAGHRMLLPLKVLVKDQDGTPMPDVQVEFIVIAGGGTVEPVSALTDNGGIASTELMLDSTPGLNQVEAVVGSLSAVFNVTGLAPGYGGGAGEPNDPYQIYTAEQMNMIGAIPNDWDKSFKLMADVDLSLFDGKEGRTAFNIIGTSSAYAFTGVFDGNGHIISHLTIVGNNDLGLFGCLGSGSEVRDIGIVDVNVTGSGSRIGGLAGTARSVTRCYSTGTIRGYNYVGGLVGSSGTITQCYSAGIVSGSQYVGGLAGENPGRISTSYSNATVSGNYAGGLVGQNSGNLTNCYSTGSVTGNSIGGLVGESFHTFGTVSHCVWDMDTSGLSASFGGVGLTTGEMMDTDMLGLNGFADDPNWVLDAGLDYPRLAWQGTSGQTLPAPNIEWLAGQGTAQDPYVIETADQFVLLSKASALWDKHLILGADIDLDPNLPNMPVFDQSPIQLFTGAFDGNDHTISHLTISGVSCVGLFGRLKYSGEVRNLGLVGVDVSGYRYVGGIAGISDGGRITDCCSTGRIVAIQSNTGGFYAGGLVGYGGGTMTRCYTAGTVTGGQWSIGGLIGYTHGCVEQCYSTAEVHGGLGAGGLVGEFAGQMIQCYSAGLVHGGSRAGGLVGDNRWGSVTDCYSAGVVEGGGNVGGLVGRNLGALTNCYSTSMVSGSSFVGGLVGSADAGGLQPAGTATVTHSFWDIQTSGQATSEGGTGKTTAEMRTASTFLGGGWDFVGETVNGTEDIWWIDEGLDYPRLWWEAAGE
ncbi:MAG TPA: GLUG motif-containing protein [Sedimentisphaerales bacterium]|jgi:hypothetical protein|nr:GLUG motif-containing protein [Sedimentisphaerales bacterium]HNU30964.1 GLUG motif-containing protein [Sedimentisphaerales bacterium]